MELKKGISFFGVFSIASGAMISSGVFILPALAYSQVGAGVFISYFIAGLLALIGSFSIIELATAMPKAGGDYFFINKTFGPMVGTISGFMGWVALSLKSAFAIFGITEIIFLYTGFSPLISGLILCLFFVAINIIGVKEAAILQFVMIIVLLSLMLIYVFFALPKVQSAYFSTFMDVGMNKILITSGFVFISFGGLLKVANISEEVKNPKRNIPLGIITSIIVVTILYTLITYAISGTLVPSVLKASLTPVADSAKLIMGLGGYIIIIIASLLAFFTTANAGIMAASRYPMALSRDKLLPRHLALVNRRFKTPTYAIIITGIIIFLSLLLPLEMLIKAASTIILTSYVLTNLSVIIFRESKIINYKPSFKTPFYPWLQIFCIVLFTFFIIELGTEAIELSLAILLICFSIYMFYGRKKKKGEYALLHLLKRITDKKLLKTTLEDELREILINRDNIEQDNFDNLIKTAVIIDIEDGIDFETLLNRIAKQISKIIDIPEQKIISQFLERQKESNTAVSDFLAIPHIVIDGSNKMFLTIVRAKEGIKFTEKENDVKAVFLLMGTKEKRILHLKALASIASLIGQKNFQNNWLKISDTIELKNLMLLSNRKRFR